LGVPQQRGGLGVWAWVAMFVSVALGLTIGFVVFGGKTKEVTKIVVVQAEAGPGTASEQVASQTTETTPEAETEAKATGPKGKSKGGTAAPTSEKETGGITGLKGLKGLQGLGPTTSGPGQTSASGGGGQPLDSSTLQATVGRYTPSVKRGCWQPALDARDKDAPSTARVSVSITLKPNGSVSNATTSGDPKGYRGLANCIAGRVRGWQFPPSNGSTTVNVPFVFAAQ
jgi:hypothetical protein